MKRRRFCGLAGALAVAGCVIARWGLWRGVRAAEPDGRGRHRYPGRVVRLRGADVARQAPWAG